LSGKRWTWILIICVVSTIAFVSLCWYLFTFLNSQLDAKEAAISDTEHILSSLHGNPNASPPTPYVLWIDEKCWLFLQDAMKKNSGEYTANVTYYNLDDPNYKYRPVDEVTVGVSFPDGRQAEFYYYEGGLNGCREITLK
jgi:hypothetical protein